MLRGLYTASSAMIANERKHDIATNNIANLNTPGYKEVQGVSHAFPEMLIQMMDKQQNKQVGVINTGTFLEETLPLFTQGDLMETKRAGDFALISNIQVFENIDGVEQAIQFDAAGKAVNQNGETIFQPQAFFTTINNEGEQRYTRDGKFQIDANGMLTTLQGRQVVGANGQPLDLSSITLLPSNTTVLNVAIDQLQIGSNGTIHDAATGQQVLDAQGQLAQLYIAQVDDPYRLIREGDGAFRLDEPEENPPQQLIDNTQFSVQQGYVERSNVDAAQASVNLMTALRAYEANQRVIQYFDRSLDKAVNEIGRV